MLSDICTKTVEAVDVDFSGNLNWRNVLYCGFGVAPDGVAGCVGCASVSAVS
jgi:hypothetical protein